MAVADEIQKKVPAPHNKRNNMKTKKEGLEFFGVHLAKEWADILREHSEVYGRSLSGEIRQLIKEAIGYREQTTHQFAKPKRKK